MLQFYAEYILLLFLSLAAFCDIKKGKIPNLIIIMGTGIGPLIYGTEFIIRFMISIFLLMIFFRLRFFGAGDLKLSALIFAWLGFEKGAQGLFTALMIAAVVSAFILVKKKLFISRARIFWEYLKSVSDMSRYKGGLFSNLSKIPAYPALLPKKDVSEKNNSYGSERIPMAVFILAGFVSVHF